MSVTNLGVATAARMSHDEAVERRLHELRQLAAQYAKARADLEYVREYRKSKKATLMAQAEREGIQSAAKAEVYAYAHPEYLQVLDALREAVEDAERLRYELEVIQMRFDYWRSREATKRAEMSMR